MAVPINDVKIKELSLVFGEHKGESWSPVNADARVLAFKGAKEEKRSFASDLIAKIKGWALDGPVTGGVPDTIDGDGDGDNDYNSIVALISQMYNDLQSVLWVQEPSVRANAVVRVIDVFLAQLDALRAGKVADTGKAGARHSAADKAAIAKMHEAHEKMAAQHAKMGDSLGAMNDAMTSLGAGTSSDGTEPAAKAEEQQALEAFAPGDLGDDGYPSNMDEYRAQSEKAKKKDRPDPYNLPEDQYADPKNGKYPIDTEEHARAAWSYINQEKNASEYSADDLKAVRGRIIAACKKFGIEIDTKKADVENNGSFDAQAVSEQIAQTVADATTASKAAVEAMIADVRKAADEQIASARNEAETAKAAAEVLKAEVATIVEKARKPVGEGGVSTVSQDGHVANPAGLTHKAATEVVKGKNTLDGTLALLAAARGG